jgi:hypothetical protein
VPTGSVYWNLDNFVQRASRRELFDLWVVLVKHCQAEVPPTEVSIRRSNCKDKFENHLANDDDPSGEPLTQHEGRPQVSCMRVYLGRMYFISIPKTVT